MLIITVAISLMIMGIAEANILDNFINWLFGISKIGDANIDPYWLTADEQGGLMTREYSTLTYSMIEEDPKYELKINDLHKTEKDCLYLDASIGLKKAPVLSANFTTYNISSIETNVPFKINNYTVLLTLTNTSTLSTKQISSNFEICNIGNVTEIAPFVITLGSASTSVVAWFNANLEIYNGRINVTIYKNFGTVRNLIDTNRTEWVKGFAVDDYTEAFATDATKRRQPFVGSLVASHPEWSAVNTTLRINTPPMVWTYSIGNDTQQTAKNQSRNWNTQEFVILSGEDFFYKRVYLRSNETGNYSSDWSSFVPANVINIGNTSMNYSIATKCAGGLDISIINSTYRGTMGYTLYKLGGTSDQFVITGSSMNTTTGMYKFQCENDTKDLLIWHGEWGGASWLQSMINNTLVNYRIGFIPRVRMDFTGAGGSGLYYNVTRYNSILIGSSTITNRTAGCIQGMFGLNTSDFFTCNGAESNGVWALNVTIAPNVNVTGNRIYLMIQNFTMIPYQQIFIYNSSSAVPVANQLGLHLANETGTWVYVNDANMTKGGNATINAGTYNYTGMVRGGTGVTMILQADAYASTNLIIQNVTMAVTGTTTTTTTTIPANCWTYDNVNHVLIIPSGCVYHNDTVGIIT